MSSKQFELTVVQMRSISVLYCHAVPDPAHDVDFNLDNKSLEQMIPLSLSAFWIIPTLLILLGLTPNPRMKCLTTAATVLMCNFLNFITSDFFFN